MAQDIIPITLALTAGDLVTLWAPRWREDGEEWEAFLGDGDALFAFADAADLAAWIRAAEEAGTEHDLADHPAWSVVGKLSVDELTPEDVQRYDVVGVPELVAADPDTGTVDDLAEVAAMVRSLADVCDLETVTEILDEGPFDQLPRGTPAFSGREGAAVWADLADVVADRWDEVVDALDAVVSVPEVDAGLAAELRATATIGTEPGDLDADPDAEDPDDAHAAAAAEDAEDAEDAANHPADTAAVVDDPQDSAVAGPEPDAPVSLRKDEAGDSLRSGLVDAAEEEQAGFWDEVGIDPIAITTADGEFVTLRCFLDDEPVFLGSGGRIDVFSSPRALRQWIAASGDGGGADGHDLAEVATWDEVVTRATGGDLEIEVAEDNRYVLVGIAEDLGEGPTDVDPAQLELAVELFRDAADWADDDSVDRALAPSESLGWLVSFVLRPDPTRLTPSPPFQTEVAAWRVLEDRFVARLRAH